MPVEDIEFYSEPKHGPVLPQELVRQLAALAWRVLLVDGRESIYLDENRRFRTAKVARLRSNMALVADNKKVSCYLIEEGDAGGFNLKAKRRLFSFEVDDLGTPADWRLKEECGPPDLWYDVAVTEFVQRLDELPIRIDNG